MIPAHAWVALAEVARPHGVRGELRLRVYNRDSDILLMQDEILVRLPSGEEHEVSVDHARRADQAILLKLYSVDDRDRAEELRGAHICARRGVFPEPEEGEFYACDIEGARVVVAESGRVRDVGTVIALRTYPSIDALAVRPANGGADFEVPLVEAFVGGVDVQAGIVTLTTLEGLET